MQTYQAIIHTAFQYYGIDWLVMITAFLCLFLIGDRNRIGFVFGMLSAMFGMLFSYQIGSIANAISSIVVFILYLRGFMHWRAPLAAPASTEAPSDSLVA